MRWTRAVVLASALSIMTTGCGAGPSDRPGVAIERAPMQEKPNTSAPAPAPPEAEVPKNDLSWRECTQPTFDRLELGPAPEGLVLDCAEYETPIDAAGSVIGSFRTAAVRARLPQTPADAAPLVLTSGTDRPSTETLAGMATDPKNALLAAQPIVAVDRRGIGDTWPVTCLPEQIRNGMHNNAQFAPGNDPMAAMTEFSQDGTIACRDYLQPYASTLDTAHAADDIEELRKRWQVEHISLLGTGNGGLVALDYARKFGDHLARLILDSPTPFGTDTLTRTEQQVQGAEAALNAFAQRCTGLGCSLSPDPRAAVLDVVDKAANGELGNISANGILTAVTGFLGNPRANNDERVSELADAVAAARQGDRGPLGSLVERETTATASDGQFVSGCTDAGQPPSTSQISEAAKTWGEKYPAFGRATAISLLTCSAWPAGPPTPAPEKLELPVLVLTGVADPVAGIGQASVAGALGTAGARHSTVSWQGWGHPVNAHSSCAQQISANYLKNNELPSDGTACPA